MVAKDDAGQGDEGREELPEDLEDLTEEEIEEMAEVLGKQMSAEEAEALDAVTWLLCQVEAVGSLKDVMEMGRLEGAPEELRDMVALMVPESRGGKAGGKSAEGQWEDFVSTMKSENGEDFFERVRAEMGIE